MDQTDMLLHDAPALAEPSSPTPVALDPARLPALAAATARQHRLAVDERLRALLAHVLGVAGWASGTRNPIDPARAAVIRLRWGMQTASFVIDLSQHPELASLAAGGEPARANVRTAVAAILLAPLLCALEQLGIEGVEIVSLERRMPAKHAAECCALAFRIGAQRIDAVLEHIDDGWLDTLEQIVARQCTPIATHVSEIAVPGRLRVGEKTISITTLESLRPGDVILGAVPASVGALLANEVASVRMEVVWGRFGTRQLRAMVDVAQDKFTLNEDPTVSHDTQFNAPLTDSVDSPVGISHLDLPLKLEIDAVSLPVAQLSALRAGYVLELPTAIPDARIRLVTYGQTIGFGELVSVGDHLGVRLVQLSQSHGSV
jgi:type III secretion protein Q